MAFNRTLAHFTSSQELATEWASGQSYIVNQIVIQSNVLYKCLIAHTSGLSFSTDLAAGRWVSISGGSVAPTDTPITTLDIDWSSGDTFYKSVTTNSTFTFSNLINGKSITIFIKNTSAGNIVLSFPLALKSGVLNLVVNPNKENAYTFVRSDNKLYVNAITDFE